VAALGRGLGNQSIFHLAAVQARNRLRKPVSVTYRTGLGRAETEIGKW
jgi:hypothetical protein